MRTLRTSRVALAAVVLSAAAFRAPPAACATELRWTDATPDAMIGDAVERATAAPSSPDARAAALATIAALADRAMYGVAASALERTAATGAVPAEWRSQASLLARSLSSDEGTEVGRRRDHALGIAERVLVLGPFRDTGGGLDLHDGPESPGAAFDPSARYSWGSYEVAWRAVPPAFSGARGVPLDVFVFPRKESCTWLATGLRVSSPRSLSLAVASTGQIRVVFDGRDVARDDAVQQAARFDRVAARVQASAGDHVFAVKVCAGALDDEGRARLRVSDDSGAWPEGVVETGELHLPTQALPRAAARRVASPLEEALGGAPAGGPGTGAKPGDVDAALDSAIVRTLGGADDLRSPRAPGSLAALAARGLDADRLAMAAWVTPDGAARGAWLGRARDGADARTRAFIGRRLVERHIEAQLSDWACAALRGAHIDEAGDPEAAVLSARVDRALGTDALRIRGVRRLAEIARTSPGTVPSALLDALARDARDIDPTTALWARDILSGRGHVDADDIRAVAVVRGAADAARAARHAYDDGALEDADDAVEAADAVARAGAHGEALRLYEDLTAWAPNRAPVWAGLSRERGYAARSRARGPADANAAPVDARSASLDALRRARELDPGEAKYRAELALRTRAPSLSSDARDDEKYLVPSDVILARRQGVGRAPVAAAVPATGPHDGQGGPGAKSLSPPPVTDSPDVADRQLHWLRAVVMHADRRVSELVHYAREIVIPPRTEDDLYEDVPAEGDLTEILRARVHRKDGSTAYPVEEANDGAKPRIRWPELAPGDVVEVAFRSWTAGSVGGRGDPPFYRLDYAGALSTHPVLYNEVVVDSPVSSPIYASVVNGKPDSRQDTENGGRHVTRLVWTKPVNVPDEPLSPPLSEVIPTVVLSTFENWSAFRAWYGEAVRGFTEPDAQVRALAADLTRGRTTRDDKLRAIFDFVADDIRYVNYVSGEWWLPNRPQQLLARREGDCDDKALLLITLLRAAGIEAQEVMVQTRMTGQPSILRAHGAAVPLFDHGIAFLPGPGDGLYLDATSPQSRLGPLPSMDARAVALKMDGPPEIVALPASSPDDHGVDATWTVDLAPDGSASLDGRERATGDDAFWMRTYLTEPGARAQWLEDRLAGSFFSSIQVDKDVDFRGDLPRGAATVHWRGRSAGLARHEGQDLVVPLSPSQTLASQLAPLVRRTLPVWLPPNLAPRKEARTIRLRAPAGWTFDVLPPGGDVDGGAFGRAHLDVSKDPADPRTAVVRRVVVFDQSTIGRDEYPKWRAWVQRVDALMHEAVRLTPSAAEAR